MISGDIALKNNHYYYYYYLILFSLENWNKYKCFMGKMLLISRASTNINNDKFHDFQLLSYI